MSNKDTCDIFCYDAQKVNQIQGELQNIDISAIARMFKVIGDENRAKITFALTKHEELCVCDIANIIGATVANASHHLRVLYKQGIVKYRKEGKLAFYSIDNDMIRAIIGLSLSNAEEVKANV